MMKNIHVLPTDKPSRLYTNARYKHYEFCELPRISTAYKKCHNIYITSDEEIKRYLDYYLDINTNEVKTSFENIGKYSPNEKKIILTTDQDLIKDGVQAIDDEFLEWFVKNPSCENVEVVKDRVFRLDEFNQREFYNQYKIIIPKEEPKQETLEEAKLRQLFKNRSNCYADSDDVVQAMDENCFIETIKEWQQKRSYSEEDMKDYALKCVGTYLFNGDFIADNLRWRIVENNNKQFEKFKKQIK